MKNLQTFILEAKTINGNDYDYSNSIYDGIFSNVEIFCNKCKKIFFQTPSNHIYKKTKCPHCLLISKTKTFEQFIEDATKVHGDKYNYFPPYIKANVKIKIQHKECGAFFEQVPNSHLNGSGCTDCFINRTKTFEQFVEDAAKVHSDKYNYFPPYINAYTKIKLQHKECGCFFEQDPTTHLSGSGCFDCYGPKIITFNEFVERSKVIHGDKYLYSEPYINTKIKTKIYHKECDGYFNQIPEAHMSGRGCTMCFTKKLKTHEEFVAQAKKIHNNEYEYISKYINSKSYIKIIHLKCGNEFMQIANNHIRGTSCPFCWLQNVSKAENLWLDELNILAENRQYSIMGYELYNPETCDFIQVANTKGFLFDGYNPITNTLFEFHGNYWHGDPAIYGQWDFNKKVKMTFGELYNKTLIKKIYALSLGYNYVDKWQVSSKRRKQ